MTQSNIEVSWRTLWKVFLMLILAVGLFLVREILLILFLAIVISSALDRPVSFLEKKKIPRILSTFLIFLLTLSVVALVLYIIIPISILELKSLLTNLNQIEIPIFGNLDTSQILDYLNRGLGSWGDLLFSGGISFVSTISAIFGNVILIITSLVLSFYLTVNRSGVEKFLRAVLPVYYEDQIVDIYYRVRKRLGLWLQGQLVLMFSVGLATFIGLTILGVRFGLILGILAGLLEIVPIAGPIFTGLMAFIVAASQSTMLGLLVIGLFFVIQQLESQILVPIVMKRAVGISPVVVVVALLAGSKIAGFAGIILAVPIAMIFQELIADREKRKIRPLMAEEE